ncbi:DEAD/DEAH box helicase family protein [Rhodovulum euryhalinum]|uniref:Type III restriction/modification enzyme restriction subunit n=1 Tax=Rhodovulum euryhalinum TaxID=35805 RepID=A0A4R2K9P0_9RHOB|nr:DEAD/DEAH box helicase family protein [Rhodovulum euryhalinum]TCO70151.1 type III restriction/modification enzyme restriction subunit [Rhodovulum euryhalinum]
MTTAPFDRMAFRYPWRDYQARVLAELDRHFDDERLHVVAAPGAGKTVLGLEVIRRIGRPTLVLAPSLAIRTQWADRLVQLFLPEGAPADGISCDLARPAPVTIATYQALHQLRDPAPLLAHGFGLVVLDEAHHLRKSWWETLTALLKRLEARTVALTATPPYDVTSEEWRRYAALCGPIDAEISIPELVRSGDLAPHRDLVHLSEARDRPDLDAMARTNARLWTELRCDPDLVAMVAAHPWLTAPRDHLTALLDAPDLFAAMLVYLADAGAPVPPDALHILGLRARDLPRLDPETLRVLCQGCLDRLPARVTALLTETGALYRGRVSLPLVDPESTEQVLRNAPEKFDSIRAIVRLERDDLGDRLRMAILTEHIGHGGLALAARDPGLFGPDRFLAALAGNPLLGRIDAVTLFERLRQEPGTPDRIALATGSVVIVPRGLLSGDGVAPRPLPQDPRFDLVALSGRASEQRVHLVSGLLARGAVHLLIGTRALLGQGWDLPALNTLVLAGNVKSFVGANQARGRVIRRDPADPVKAAHIWHIATRAPGLPGGGPEIAALEDRFGAFLRLSPDGKQIRSGAPALGDPAAVNARSAALARCRADMAGAWQDALETGSAAPRVHHRLATRRTPRALVVRGALARGLPGVGLAAGLAGGWAVLSGQALPGLGVAIASGLALAPASRQAWRLIRHGTLTGSLRETGLALLHAMASTGLLKTPLDAVGIATGRDAAGLAWCSPTGVTLPEEMRFLALLDELLSPIGNPRYLLIAESYLGRVLRAAPYAVPTPFGTHKERATQFLDSWNRHVGPARLVFTRTVEGRRALLRARLTALAEYRHTHQSSFWH